MTTSTARATSGGESSDRLQQAASDVVDRTTETVGNRVEGELGGQLQRAGDILGSLAQAVRQGGEQVRDQQPQVATVADSAASQLDRVAGHVRQSSPRELIADVEQFARQQPAVFIGGALLIGAVTARLLKASPQAGNGARAGYRSSYSSDHGSGSSYGAGPMTTGTIDDGGF